MADGMARRVDYESEAIGDARARLYQIGEPGLDRASLHRFSE
jgi:hypothetical protein